ncbi:hypothetical protein PAMP_003997 [Pampus punctatissimus]
MRAGLFLKITSLYDMLSNHFESSAGEQDPASPERGLLHIWQSRGLSEQLCPERVLPSRCVLQVVLGEHHGLLLTQGGHVYSFGELFWRGQSIPVSAPVLEVSLLGRTVVRVAAGGFHCGALSEQGNIYMWGENTAGQCGPTERGTATNITVSEPCPVTVVDNEVVPPVVVRVVDLACGREHSLALSDQNELWAWGSGCQLGLVTSTFPVWRPQKVEHLAGRHVIQVACGAYHSLALVRSLPQQNYTTQKPPEKKERGQSPRYSLTEKEQLLAVDDAHYCPLGVELTEVMTAETSPRRTRPRHTLQPGGRSAGRSPGSGASPCPYSEDGKSNTKKKNLPAGTNLEPDEHTDPLTQTDNNPKSQTLSAKSSVFPDEMELQNPLQKLSGHSLETRHASGPGDTDSLSSQTSDDSCVSSTPSTDLFTSSYKDDSSIKSQSNNSGGVAGIYSSSSPVCLEEVQLRLEKEKHTLQGQKSSSLTDINQKGKTGANRRCSLPGTPTHGSPRRRHPCACSPSSTGRTHAAAQEVAGDTLPSLETEVWSWGRGSEGQLGHGDQLASTTTKMLADHNVMGFISAIHELASRERQFYCWLSSVRKLLLTPLCNRGEPCTHLFFSLCENLVRLSVLIGRHATSLSYFLHDVQCRDVTSLHLLTHTEHFLDIYKEYCSSVGDLQVMGGFQSLQKLSLECLGSQLRMLTQLCVSDQSASGDVDLVSLLYWPLQQLHQYGRVLLKLAACYDVLTTEYQSLHQGSNQYESLSLSLLRRKKEAENTFHFWKTHSGKTTEVLRLPQRRVVCESSHRSLTLQNAGRFSNHWFILFNDALVHTQGAIPSQSLFSTHHVYPLTCLWVKPVTENSSGLYALKITCPEETFTLVASTPQEKNKWLRSLNQEVDQALGGGGQGSSPGLTAMSRTASYKFTGEGRFKDAQYTGGWLAGQVHGSYGECIMPNKLLNKADSYQGHWKEGKIHGFGKYKYASGEVYEGCFCDGQRHGYGMLSSGKLARTSSSVFIGQWVHDRKTGYGVYDDITRGEKYMGLWLDDQRHGSAVVVTQHCVYYEGTFRENKMSGPGLLVSEDNTTLHGEFSDDWTVSGKGVLSLANGDSLEGLFNGEWTAGLKVVGTYYKPAVNGPEDKDRNNQLSNLSRSQTKILQSLELIPQHGEPVNTANYDSIRRYLTKVEIMACETLHHPLGWLVETLVTVYRMTYVGVGSNRRLLRQAVQEVQAYLTHFYRIVRFLFPGLPDDGGIILDTPDSPSKSKHNSDALEQGCVLVVSCSSLLLPLLLPRLYPPLFTLYCLQEEPEEAQYWERILRLNKQPDQSLLSFLGVQEKFWPVWMSILGEKKQIVSSSKDACFVSAVETLQQISTTFTPSDKLMVIQKTFEEMTQEVKPMLDGDFMWCMDDLLPLFLYVVLRARIRNLGAEVSLIEDLMDPNVQHGEMGLMFTTLKACYIQIQQESTT